MTPRGGASPGRTPSAPAPPQRARAAPADTAAIVEAVAEAVAQRYVLPDAGARIGAHVRERARQGAYARLTGGELADALTRDLRQENGDRHLYVQYQPGQAAGPAPGSRVGPGAAGRRRHARRPRT